MTRSLIALSAALLTACGQDVTFRVPIPDTCRSLASQNVPGATMPGMPAPELTWEQVETISLGEVLPDRRDGNLELHLFVRTAELTAGESGGSLGFLHAVDVTLEGSADGAVPETGLAHYEKADPNAEPGTIALTPAHVDLAGYVHGDAITVLQRFTGVPPQKETNVTPKLCVGGEAVYTVAL